MRILLFTGKGGVGKTTTAAATAALAARRGAKTLVLSTDTAHSLSDALAVQPPDEPTEVATNLYLHQVDTQRALERSWGELRDYALGALEELGLDSITAEELTVLPGAEEVLALFEVRDQVTTGRWDVIVVDCAPTAETLRLLALPEALDWHVERLLPIGRRATRVIGPLLSRATRVSMPENSVFNAIERFHRNLTDIRALLTGDDASVRLVLTPEAVVVAEARRTLTSLSLYGYRVDGVIANRVFPADGADGWRAGWVSAQAERLAEIEESFAPIPIHRVPYAGREPVGLDALADLGDLLYGTDAGKGAEAGTGTGAGAGGAAEDPFAPPAADPPLVVDGHSLSLALPLASRADIDLSRKGDELIVTAGPYRRVLALPAALSRRRVIDATLREGRLRVEFEA